MCEAGIKTSEGIIDLGDYTDSTPRGDEAMQRYASAVSLQRLLDTGGQPELGCNQWKGEGLSGIVDYES